MLYPQDIEPRLGFDKLRLWLKECCNGPVGQHFVDRMRFNTKFETVTRLLRQTEEFQSILLRGEPFPDEQYPDTAPFLERIRVEGTFLSVDELYILRRQLGTLEGCLQFFADRAAAEYPLLRELTSQLAVDRSIVREIDRILDDRGQIRDNASPELAAIRRDLLHGQSNLRKRIDQFLRSAKSSGYTADDASVTIRDGRLVIPVYAEHKRIVRGLVHDTSASGQTVFLEPEEVLHLNNEIRELELRERQEIIRILTRVTDRIRPHSEAISKANHLLGMLDFIRAKARLSNEMEGICPHVQAEPLIAWKQAVHPILLRHHRAQAKPVIPQDIRLNDEKRLLIISGPNAGGKSVALKTVGLLQYMLQCGMLIPVAPGSQSGLFGSIFIDIGDQQSLENDLSTYSSHLTNMRHFVRHARRDTLILIDEFGAGTEPQLGGAIAEAILARLHRQQVYGVITTHYANLKVFAGQTPGLQNAAMRYDPDALAPLYMLDIGQPGSSFALEIAQKIGLPGDVLDYARKKAGAKQVSMEKLLAEIEQEKRELEEQNRLIAKQQQGLQKALAETEKLKNYYEQNRRELLQKAKQEAADLLREANRTVEATIRTIREQQADKEATKQARQQLDVFKEELDKIEMPATTAAAAEEPDYEVIGGEILAGDYVQIKDSGAIGQVLSLSGKDALVSIGELRSNIRLNRLVKISRRQFREQVKNEPLFYTGSRVSAGVDLNEKMANFTSSLDLRGKRVELVLPLVEEFIDQAIMLNQRDVRIVHGKGDGILREAVRSHLRRYKEVARMEDEHADRGGAGATIVTLK